MCSVSWLVDEGGYQVFFNRDEQKSRALALPPTQLQVSGVEVLMPVDPVGNGSWISMNEFGLSLCLLNNYQGVMPCQSLKTEASHEGILLDGSIMQGSLVSRGLLLKHLSSCVNSQQVKEAFVMLNLNQFAPFTLLVFDSQLNSQNPSVQALEWDGRHSSIHNTDCPLFSSSVDLNAVSAYRLQVYQSLTKQGKSTESLLAFHTHHHASQPHMSTCMHRDDAQTVSFTHLRVEGGIQRMAYVPGSPCENLNSQTLEQHIYQLRAATSLVS
ncbi:NRDE family protein [Vibrio paucivorans]|uniref:NRDE family protein n=1 Tax=Vibrio paucivorans TaxID=2829489 RepID=A0A9X3CGE4_9VIBR|nr:NRDE family protein [Vibrio paucivorans]MCW8335220.1 NRDE family protein [Vibrio paucivorans]